MFLKLGIMDSSKHFGSFILEMVCLVKNRPTFASLLCFSTLRNFSRKILEQPFWSELLALVFLCVFHFGIGWQCVKLVHLMHWILFRAGLHLGAAQVRREQVRERPPWHERGVGEIGL